MAEEVSDTFEQQAAPFEGDDGRQYGKRNEVVGNEADHVVSLGVNTSSNLLATIANRASHSSTR